MARRKIIIIDDDKAVLEQVGALLKADWDVHACSDSSSAFATIKARQPEVVLSDLTMPRVTGMQLCRQVKQDPATSGVIFILSTSKAYESDRTNALKAGADGYIVKPFSLEKMRAILDSIDHMKVTFWGVRGTLPIPTQGFVAYGGNTSCISLSLSKDRLFIFDAGTGIKHLSNHLMSSGVKRIQASLFITHSHWDHINAFPFFVPLFRQGNDIAVYGSCQGLKPFQKVMEDQMDGDYFPITVREFAAHVTFNEITYGDYSFDGIQVSTIMLKHPNNCLGYRINYKDKSFCYITDNELYLPDSEFADPHFWDLLTDFVKGTDMLVHDATYHDDEYRKKVNWGHSCVSQVARLADEAGVKRLYLFHHDPDQDDLSIGRKLESAKALLSAAQSETECFLARERESVSL